MDVAVKYLFSLLENSNGWESHDVLWRFIAESRLQQSSFIRLRDETLVSQLESFERNIDTFGSTYPELELFQLDLIRAILQGEFQPASEAVLQNILPIQTGFKLEFKRLSIESSLADPSFHYAEPYDENDIASEPSWFRAWRSIGDHLAANERVVALSSPDPILLWCSLGLLANSLVEVEVLTRKFPEYFEKSVRSTLGQSSEMSTSLQEINRFFVNKLNIVFELLVYLIDTCALLIPVYGRVSMHRIVLEAPEDRRKFDGILDVMQLESRSCLQIVRTMFEVFELVPDLTSNVDLWAEVPSLSFRD